MKYCRLLGLLLFCMLTLHAPRSHGSTLVCGDLFADIIFHPEVLQVSREELIGVEGPMQSVANYYAGVIGDIIKAPHLTHGKPVESNVRFVAKLTGLSKVLDVSNVPYKTLETRRNGTEARSLENWPSKWGDYEWGSIFFKRFLSEKLHHFGSTKVTILVTKDSETDTRTLEIWTHSTASP